MKLATPLLDVVASSAEIVRVSVAETTASMPSPDVNVKVSPKATACDVFPSVMVNEAFANLALAIEPAN